VNWFLRITVSVLTPQQFEGYFPAKALAHGQVHPQPGQRLKQNGVGQRPSVDPIKADLP
jgi:hypothetical protein